MKWRPLESNTTQLLSWHGNQGGAKLEAEDRVEGLAMCVKARLILKGDLLVEFRGAPAFTSCSTMAGVSEARLVTV